MSDEQLKQDVNTIDSADNGECVPVVSNPTEIARELERLENEGGPAVVVGKLTQDEIDRISASDTNANNMTPLADPDARILDLEAELDRINGELLKQRRMIDALYAEVGKGGTKVRQRLDAAAGN